jgi:hypothetical protein
MDPPSIHSNPLPFEIIRSRAIGDPLLLPGYEVFSSGRMSVHIFRATMNPAPPNRTLFDRLSSVAPNN